MFGLGTKEPINTRLNLRATKLINTKDFHGSCSSASKGQVAFNDMASIRFDSFLSMESVHSSGCAGMFTFEVLINVHRIRMAMSVAKGYPELIF